MNEWKVKRSKENSIALNRLAREEMKLRLLKDIRVDLAICEVEGLSKKEYINESGGNISWGIADKCSAFQFEYAEGNCFATEEEAKKHLENLKTKGELRLLAEELNGSRVIDWQDYDQDKYYLFYDNDGEFSGEFLCGDVETFAQSQGVIYCLSENFCEEAIKRIGEERLIRMIQSGV